MNEFKALWQHSDWRGVQYIIADKGYDCGKVRNQISTMRVRRQLFQGEKELFFQAFEIKNDIRLALLLSVFLVR